MYIYAIDLVTSCRLNQRAADDLTSFSLPQHFDDNILTGRTKLSDLISYIVSYEDSQPHLDLIFRLQNLPRMPHDKDSSSWQKAHSRYSWCVQWLITFNKARGRLVGQMQGEEEVRSYKILVLGNSGAGKTSLVRRSVRDYFSRDYRSAVAQPDIVWASDLDVVVSKMCEFNDR